MASDALTSRASLDIGMAVEWPMSSNNWKRGAQKMPIWLTRLIASKREFHDSSAAPFVLCQTQQPQTMKRISILLFASFALLCGQSHAAEKPNLLFILADDLGWSDTTLHGSRKGQTRR